MGEKAQGKIRREKRPGASVESGVQHGIGKSGRPVT